MSKATKRERQKENRERARVERERLMKRDRRMKAVRGLAILMAVFVVGILIINAITSNDARTFDKNKNYTATIETSLGNITVALDAKTAPIATKHFIELADKGYYDGLCIDRLAKDYLIQGGSPKCDLQGGTGKSVNGEVPTDSYPIGSLAAAKSDKAPAGTFDAQFFVVTGSHGAKLPNDWARFGHVVAGLDVAQKIEQQALTPTKATDPNDGKPVTKITIKRIRITETKTPVLSSTSNPTSSTTAAPASSTSSAPAASSTTSTTKP